jgi:hypothetical protein
MLFVTFKLSLQMGFYKWVNWWRFQKKTSWLSTSSSCGVMCRMFNVVYKGTAGASYFPRALQVCGMPGRALDARWR